jgi:hypothetical protein
MKTRYGCLAGLFVVAACAAVASWADADREPQGPVTVVFFLAAALAVLYAFSFVDRSTTRPKIEQRGFPVIPLPPRPPDRER